MASEPVERYPEMIGFAEPQPPEMRDFVRVPPRQGRFLVIHHCCLYDFDDDKGAEVL